MIFGELSPDGAFRPDTHLTHAASIRLTSIPKHHIGPPPRGRGRDRWVSYRWLASRTGSRSANRTAPEPRIGSRMRLFTSGVLELFPLRNGRSATGIYRDRCRELNHQVLLRQCCTTGRLPPKASKRIVSTQRDADFSLVTRGACLSGVTSQNALLPADIHPISE